MTVSLNPNHFNLTAYARLFLAIVLGVCAISPVTAAPVMPGGNPATGQLEKGDSGSLRRNSGRGNGSTAARAAELRSRIASRQAALAQDEAAAEAAAFEQADKNSKLVTVPAPTQDRFGDPMYAFWGPLPVRVGTPQYDGPRYAASFERVTMQTMPDGEYRGYARGAFSNPGLTAQTDVTLGVGTNQSYLQQGMRIAPGSMAPSAARVMTNNR